MTKDLPHLESEYTDVEFHVDRLVELRAIANMLRRAQGFTLAFAQCNQPAERRKLVSELRQLLGAYSIAEFGLTESVESLLDELIPLLPDHNDADAMFVYGLEHSILSGYEFSPLIANLNVSRNLFPRYISCPLVLWLSTFSLSAIMRGAPDFFSWRSALYQFPSSPEMLAEISQDIVDGDARIEFNLRAEEKKERIAVIESILADYESLQPDRSNRLTKNRLFYRLGILYYSLGDYPEAEASYLRSLKISEELGYKSGMSASLYRLGAISKARGNYSEAECYYRRSLDISKELRDERHTATALSQIGAIAESQGDHEAAERFYQESIEILGWLGDKVGIAISLHRLGRIAERQERFDSAEHFHRRGLDISNQLGNKLGIAIALGQLGDVARLKRDYNEAEYYYREGLEIQETLGNKFGIAIQLDKLGRIARLRGLYSVAENYQRQSLRLKTELGNKFGIAISLDEFGTIFRKQEEYGKAVKLLGAALAIFEQIGSPRRESTRETLMRLREHIGERNFEALFKEAQADPEKIIRGILEAD